MAKNHIVVFQDASGNVIKTAFVPDKGEAKAPVVPEKNAESEHHEYLFDGWDQDIACVRENLVVKPVYRKTPKQYLVMYFHEDGRVLGTESVPCFEPARQPYHPQKEGDAQYYYEFEGWDRDLSSIEKDTMAKAVFEQKRHHYPVRFFTEDGNLISEEEVYYGEAATEPEPPVKDSNPTYHYLFDGWDKTFAFVTGPVDIRARYRAEYNEYHITFAEENEDFLEEVLHYGEDIVYPGLFRKGYTLSWTPSPRTAQQDERIQAHYQFANPKGKVIDQDHASFEICNPSISHGTAKILRWKDPSREKSLKIPSRVKLGDYWYEVEAVGTKAFSQCENAQKIILPDTVKRLDDESFGGCAGLREVEIGRGLVRMGRKVFRGSHHLRKITIHSAGLRLIHRETFAEISRETELQIVKFHNQRVEDRIRRLSCKVVIL